MLETDFIATWVPITTVMPAPFRDCTTLSVICRAAPGVIKALLPAPLQSSSKHVDVFSLSFMRATVFGRLIEVAEFGFPCEYKGMKAVHCPLEYTSPDDSLCLGREIWSWPKKYGHFSWNQKGDELSVEVSANDSVLMKAKFVPAEDAGETSAEQQDLVGFRDEVPYLQVKYLAQEADSDPVRAEILKVEIPWGRGISSTSGKAKVELIDGSWDPITVLQPVEILSARLDRHEFDFDLGTLIDVVELPAGVDPYKVVQFALAKASPKVLRGPGFGNRPIPSTQSRDWTHLNPPMPKRER